MGPNGSPYVQPSQLTQYLPAATLNLSTGAQQLQACLDATEEADSYLRGRGPVPLSTSNAVGLLAWGNDLTRYTAYIAIYLLMSGPIGGAAGAGAKGIDQNITTNYYRAVGWPDRPGTGWFPGVQRQAIQPDITWSSTPGADPAHDAPQVSTNCVRGWYQRGGRAVGGF